MDETNQALASLLKEIIRPEFQTPGLVAAILRELDRLYRIKMNGESHA